MVLDNLDLQVLKLLQEDGRTPFREIASKLGVAEGTVYNRLERLKSAGVLTGFTVSLNPEALGFDLSAIVGVKVRGGQSLDIAGELGKKPEVLCVYDVTGEFDTLLVVRTRSRKELDKFIKSLHKIPQIERTYTQVILNTVKEDLRLKL